jgi:hypothetical protein
VERNVLNTGLVGNHVLVPLEIDIDEIRVGIDESLREGRLGGILVTEGLGVGTVLQRSPVGEVTVDCDGSGDRLSRFAEIRNLRQGGVLLDIDDLKTVVPTSISHALHLPTA